MRVSYLAVAAVVACAMSVIPGAIPAANASVVLSATRVVHEGDARDVGVRLTNKRNGPALVEVWVEPADAAASKQGQPPAFVPTPPLFRIESGRGQVVRLHRTQAPLPPDRESVFWLHVLDVPPNPVDTSDTRMKIALRSRIKLFHRPAGLPGTAAKAPDRLRFQLVRKDVEMPALRIDNPTPFHVTISRVGDGALAMRGEMVAPFGHLILSLDGASAAPEAEAHDAETLAAARAAAWRDGERLRFDFLNDSGGAETRSARLSGATLSVVTP